MGKGERTRERILEIAEAAVLQKGFGATSIDELIAEAEITKGGFFYHFKDKNELARALLQRYIDQDEVILGRLFDPAEDPANDPREAFLQGPEGFAGLVADLPAGHPGCVVATYCYQERLFDKAVRDLNRAAVLGWRRRFHTILQAIARRHPPREAVELEALADMVMAVMEGGIVLSKALNDPPVLAQQVLLLRTFFKLLFAGPAADGSPLAFSPNTP